MLHHYLRVILPNIVRLPPPLKNRYICRPLALSSSPRSSSPMPMTCFGAPSSLVSRRGDYRGLPVRVPVTFMGHSVCWFMVYVHLYWCFTPNTYFIESIGAGAGGQSPPHSPISPERHDTPGPGFLSAEESIIILLQRKNTPGRFFLSRGHGHLLDRKLVGVFVSLV